MQQARAARGLAPRAGPGSGGSTTSLLHPDPLHQAAPSVVALQQTGRGVLRTHSGGGGDGRGGGGGGGGGGTPASSSSSSAFHHGGGGVAIIPDTEITVSGSGSSTTNKASSSSSVVTIVGVGNTSTGGHSVGGGGGLGAPSSAGTTPTTTTTATTTAKREKRVRVEFVGMEDLESQKKDVDADLRRLSGKGSGSSRYSRPRMSLLGKPLNYRAHKRDARYRRLQARVYNFLERPKDWRAISYHLVV